MITLKDIKIAVNSKLISKFSTVELQSNDVQEGFKRPSFFVRLDNTTSSSTEYQIQRSLTVRISYFPSDRHNHSVELLEVQEQLEDSFDLKLNVLERKFTIIEAETNVTDGVLHFYFDIEYEEGKNLPDHELMETLEYKNEKG